MENDKIVTIETGACVSFECVSNLDPKIRARVFRGETMVKQSSIASATEPGR